MCIQTNSALNQTMQQLLLKNNQVWQYMKIFSSMQTLKDMITHVYYLKKLLNHQDVS